MAGHPASSTCCVSVVVACCVHCQAGNPLLLGDRGRGGARGTKETQEGQRRGTERCKYFHMSR